MQGTNPVIPPQDSANRLVEALNEGIHRNASDWHFVPGSKPKIRVEGDVRDLQCDPSVWDDNRILSSWAWLTGQEMAKVQTPKAFYVPDDRSVTTTLGGKSVRFRAHATAMLGGMGYNLRILPSQPRKLADLNTPQLFQKLCETRSSGLILVCGATGSGKSTTLAATIDALITSQEITVDTFESPIETLFPNGEGRKGLIKQYEIPTHIESFAKGAYSALRDDPDIVMFAELRGDEAIRDSVEVAKTGHLVFGTLHTGNSFESISRIMAARPEGSEASYLQELASSLIAVLCQRLIKDGNGKRVAVYELLIVNQTVAGVIMRADFKQLGNAMGNGRGEGMFSFDDYLVTMIQEGRIDIEAALSGSPTPRDTLDHFVNIRLINPTQEQKLRKIYVV
jgi:twitching motility protein PilT